MAPPSSKATKEVRVVPVHARESIGKPDKAGREEILSALEEWLADESGCDEKVWPELKEAIERNRLSTRKRFRD